MAVVDESDIAEVSADGLYMKSRICSRTGYPLPLW